MYTVPPATALPPAPPTETSPALAPAVPPPPPMACATMPCDDVPKVVMAVRLSMLTAPLAPPLPASAPALPNISKLPVVVPPMPPIDWPRMPIE
ncbi:hypothetical protein D3C87_1291140 [compost metagenome]